MTIAPGKPANLLSFDVEDYFHGPAFKHVSSDSWDRLESRVVANMEKVLSILGEQKATFFALGWVVAKYPGVFRELHQQGHEIACHSYSHKHIWDQSLQQFREDLIRAKKVIEDAIGAEVIGYRAPTFSITQETLWAINILRDVGFKYDSSIFPIHHDRYGIPDFPRFPFKLAVDFWEIPLSTINFLTLRVPFGGGGYFRLYPYWLTKYFIRKINQEGFPFVFYQHPWELEDLKKAKFAKPKSTLASLRRSLTIGTTENKLKKLLKGFRFEPIRDWLEERNES